MLTEVHIATYLWAAGTEREGEIWHKEERVLLQEGGGQMPGLTLQGEVANYLQNTCFQAWLYIQTFPIPSQSRIIQAFLPAPVIRGADVDIQ